MENLRKLTILLKESCSIAFGLEQSTMHIGLTAEQQNAANKAENILPLSAANPRSTNIKKTKSKSKKPRKRKSRAIQNEHNTSQVASKRESFKKSTNEPTLNSVQIRSKREVDNFDSRNYTLVKNKQKSSPNTLNIIENCHRRLKELCCAGKKQQNRAEIDRTVRKVQTQVRKWRGDKICQETLRKLGLVLENCDLIIGVDATPEFQAGYCVNLITKHIFWYKLHKNEFPIEMGEAPSSSEFEMKNLMFALTIWRTEILKYKRITLYTDNGAVAMDNLDEKNYGRSVNAKLDHYIKCKGVSVLNRRGLWVNKFRSEAGLAKFACFIKPADDLSRGHIEEALDFLSVMYGIEDQSATQSDLTDWKQAEQQQCEKLWCTLSDDLVTECGFVGTRNPQRQNIQPKCQDTSSRYPKITCLGLQASNFN